MANEEEKPHLKIERQGNEIYFYEDVTEESVMKLNMLVKKMDQEHISPIMVYIHSSGGDIFAGLSAMDHLLSLRSSVVYTVADGLCGSAATCIFLGGSKRLIKKNAHVLIHQISSGDSESETYSDVKAKVAHLDKIMLQLKNLYLSKTSIPPKKLKALMKRDVYLDADECLQYGIANNFF